MLTVIIVLVLIGVMLYIVEQIPMDATIKLIIKAVVILAVVLYLIQAFGIVDLPVPRVR